MYNINDKLRAVCNSCQLYHLSFRWKKELNIRQVAKQMKIEFKLILLTPCLEN